MIWNSNPNGNEQIKPDCQLSNPLTLVLLSNDNTYLDYIKTLNIEFIWNLSSIFL